MALALDLTRMISSCHTGWTGPWTLVCIMATLKAIKENVVHASAPHAPYVSTLVQSTWHHALVLIFIFQKSNFFFYSVRHAHVHNMCVMSLQ